MRHVQFICPFGRDDFAILQADIAGIVDAERFISRNIDMLQKHVGDTGFGQSKNQARPMPRFYCCRNITEGDVLIHRGQFRHIVGGIGRRIRGGKIFQIPEFLIFCMVGSVNQNRRADIRHAQIVVGQVVDKTSAISVRFNADAILGIVERAICDRDIGHPTLGVASNGKSVPRTVGAIGDQYVPRVAAACKIVVSHTHVAILDEDIISADITGIGIMARGDRVRGGGCLDCDPTDGYVLRSDSDMKHR